MILKDFYLVQIPLCFTELGLKIPFKPTILDIVTWVQKKEPEKQNMKNQIFYEFYEKPMASKFVIMKDSAAPLSQKRTVLTQEGIRRLKNCKAELDWSRKAEHLSNLMQKLKNSGYDEQFRLEILKSSINGFEKIVEDEKNGIKPIYRSKDWKEQNNWNTKKIFKKENWWKGNKETQNKSVIFVPATPGGELVNLFKEIQKENHRENKGEIDFQIIEQTGLSLQKLLQRSNPFSEKSCEKSECVSCDGTGVRCRTDSVGYRGVCKECKKENISSAYIGETGKNLFIRSKQHVSGLRNKNTENAFYKHWQNCHEVPLENESRRMNNYEFRVDGNFRDAMARQINEMVRMTNFQGTLLNSKSEWNAPPIVRITAENESERLISRKYTQLASGIKNSVQPTTLNEEGLRRDHMV